MFKFLYNIIKENIEDNFKLIEDYNFIHYYENEIERIDEEEISVPSNTFYISISPLQRDFESQNRAVQFLNGVFTIYYAFESFGGIKTESEYASNIALDTLEIADMIYAKFQNFKTDSGDKRYVLTEVTRASNEVIPTKKGFYFVAVSFDFTLQDNSINYETEYVTIKSITSKYSIIHRD